MYGPNNPPPDTCSECDRVIVIEEPATCHYTGGRCLPGPCDCGVSYVTTCVECGGTHELEGEDS